MEAAYKHARRRERPQGSPLTLCFASPFFTTSLPSLIFFLTVVKCAVFWKGSRTWHPALIPFALHSTHFASRIAACETDNTKVRCHSQTIVSLPRITHTHTWYHKKQSLTHTGRFNFHITNVNAATRLREYLPLSGLKHVPRRSSWDPPLDYHG